MTGIIPIEFTLRYGFIKIIYHFKFQAVQLPVNLSIILISFRALDFALVLGDASLQSSILLNLLLSH